MFQKIKMSRFLAFIIVLFIFLEQAKCYKVDDVTKTDVLFDNDEEIMADPDEGIAYSEPARNIGSPSQKINQSNLVNIGDLWSRYYDCLSRTLEGGKTLPSTMLMVYQDSVVRIPCGKCLAPGEKVEWMYSESLYNQTFNPVRDKDAAILDKDSLLMYRVTSQDAGVYRCNVGSTVVVLEVTDEDYNVVKPPSSRGPHPSPPTAARGLVVITTWTAWSECSACGEVGRRRRYGLCYVKAGGDQKNNDVPDIELEDINHLFLRFPGGVPCRSRYLPEAAKELPLIKNRSNEIMIGMCKLACLNEDLELPHNNSIMRDDLTSFEQAGRDIVFAHIGDKIVITCPGTTLRDIPVNWRIGPEVTSALALFKASEGRIYINARDQLVINNIAAGDTNLYSCWQGLNLAGTVKLEVQEGIAMHWVLLGMIIFLATTHRASVSILKNLQRRMY